MAARNQRAGERGEAHATSAAAGMADGRGGWRVAEELSACVLWQLRLAFMRRRLARHIGHLIRQKLPTELVFCIHRDLPWVVRRFWQHEGST